MKKTFLICYYLGTKIILLTCLIGLCWGGKTFAQTDSLISVARNAMQKEEYANALRAYLQAVKIEEKKGNNNQISAIYVELADAYLVGNLFEKAKEYLQKAYQAAPQEELLVKIADLDMKLLRYADALKLYKQVEETYNKKYADNPLLQLPILRKIVLAYQNQKDYQNSLLYNQKILQIQQEAGDKEGIIIAKNNIGYNYKYLKNYAAAIKYFGEVLDLEKKNNNVTTLINLGITFQNMGNYSRSIEYLLQANKIIEKSNNPRERAKMYDLLSSVYYNMKDYYNAQYYNNLAIQLAQKNQDKNTLSSAYQTTSLLFQTEEKYDKALEYFKKHLEIKDSLLVAEKLQQQELLQQQYVVERSEAELKLMLASEEIKDAQLKEAKAEAEKTEKEYKLLQQNQKLKDEQLARQALEQNKARQELLLLQQRATAERKDREILALERKKALQEAELSKKSKLEKEKEAELKILNRDKQLQDLELKKREQEIARQQEFQQLLYGIGFLGALVFGLTLYSFITTRRKNALLAQQQKLISEKNAELEQQNAEIAAQRDLVAQQNHIIVQKNDDITASITYAQRIQQAILPLPEYISHYLPQHFILFKPRDIVSGDFYFFAQITTELVQATQNPQTETTQTLSHVFISAVDCTGHGVPGAFMSVIGNEMLEQVIIQREITAPDQILNEVHKGIRKVLKQATTDNRDGMDMSLLRLSFDEQNNLLSASFAGAKNPIVYIQNNELHYIKGDKMPIGGEQKEAERCFTAHEISLQNPTTFYLFSDGYQDQFGGSDRKKFGITNLKKLLFEIHSYPMPEQQQLLEHSITTWMQDGRETQIDDILIMGIRVG